MHMGREGGREGGGGGGREDLFHKWNKNEIQAIKDVDHDEMINFHTWILWENHELPSFDILSSLIGWTIHGHG